MRAWRRYPVFSCALLGLALVLAGETAGLVRLWPAARNARRQLNEVEREFRALTTTRPAATTHNAELIEADLKRTADRLATMQSGLAADREAKDGVTLAPVPLHRSEAYFDIATFVEAMRARAQQAGVTLAPDERFGFSAYANEAPADGLTAVVFRQREVAQCLVESLLEAKPRQLLLVQRQRPMEIPVRTGAPNLNGGSMLAKGGGVGAGDYFDIDPRMSLRVPDIVATTAFRVGFTGHTSVLRDWLNRLAELEFPIVVRSVEVGPAEPTPGTVVTPRTTAALLVTPPWLHFVVTVEFVELTAAETKAS